MLIATLIISILNLFILITGLQGVNERITNLEITTDEIKENTEKVNI